MRSNANANRLRLFFQTSSLKVFALCISTLILSHQSIDHVPKPVLQVISKLHQFLHSRSVIASLLVTSVILASSQAANGQFFNDQFDGSSSVAWVLPEAPFDAGEREVINGVYWITPGTTPNGSAEPGFAESDSYAGDHRYDTFSIHTQFRAEDAARDDYWMGVFGRSSFGVEDFGASVFAALSEQGELALATSNNGPTDDNFLSFIETSLRPHQHDVDMRLDVLEDSAMLWTWHSDEAMPTVPTLVLNDLPSYLHEDGRIGIYALNHSSAPTTFGFEFFAVSQVPEPNAMSLILPGVFGLMVLRQTRCSRRAGRSSLAKLAAKATP